MRKVAIVATSFRMPGTTPERFWDDLLAGRDLVSTVEPGRWSVDTYLHPGKSHPGSAYTFAAGSLGDVSGFDAAFFGISPREASLMDPQQRLLLEMSWETFENAGIRPSTLRGSDCGVYIGISSADYSWRLADDLAAIDASFATGNTSSIAANRLSYVYDLRGPSMAIDTACSSSLIAFHQAHRAIASGEISQALTGAVSLHLHPLGFLSFSKASMLSRQGRCRVFDASADGYVRSEGGGLFLLKDFDRAVADGDPILAAVAHTAVNTDGRKSGITVPSAAAQSSLLTNAYAQAGIEPALIDYIEAHGTGTAVGDPIETRALGEALGQLRPRTQPLPIGSVKGNVGHLETASGVAGLLKVLHCLRHRIIPLHIGMDTPNPHIEFDRWNLEVVTANRALRSTGRLIAGVNSFGFGGANAHVILENHAPEPSSRPALSKARAQALPIVISARDSVALTTAARDLADLIARQPQSALYDIAYQSVHGRDRHTHCAVLFGGAPATIAATLEQFAQAPAAGLDVEHGTPLESPKGAAFIYTGNGAQWAGMGSQLLTDPVFKTAVREVDALFSRYVDYSLEAELAAQNGEGRYARTEIAQPALFALQVGVTAMLRRRGLVPVAVAGHSVGEVAAAWACGALSLAAAVSVIHHRSALQGTTRGSGNMTALNVGERRARELLQDLGLAETISIAGVNSPTGVTIAGAAADLDRVERSLAGRDIALKRLDLDYAFHSPAMDGLFLELRRALAHLEPEEATIPFYSTVSGAQLSGKSLDADYWWRNVREPVLLERTIGGMLQEGINIYVEVGPHSSLRRYLLESLDAKGVTGRVISTGIRGDDSPARIYSAASQALIAGATVDWQRLLPWPGRHARLPNYPWQRERHWHTVTSSSMGLLGRTCEHPLLGYALGQSELSWENSLDTVKHPLLADHVVGDATVFPGSGFAELALAAALRWQPGGCAEIEDLEIRAPLVLAKESSQIVRCALDARDGQVSIRSREQLKQDPWTLHAVGRVLREPGPMRLKVMLGELPTRVPDFTGHSHNLLSVAAGLSYGPTYRAVDYGWIEAGAALAVLSLPAAVGAELDSHHLHPALLDCTFQLIIELLRDCAGDFSGVILVPTRVGHLSYRGGLAPPRYARARLLSRGPRSVSAQFEIFDGAAQPIAVLEEVRFHGLSLQREAVDQIRYLEYHAVPRPLRAATTPDPGVPIGELGADLSRCFAAPSVERAHRLYAEEIDPLLDALCSRYLSEAVEQVPALCGEALAEAQTYRSHLLQVARVDGLRGLAESGAQPADEPPVSAREIWRSLLADYPDYFQIVHTVGCVGMHLADLLAGRRTLAEIWPSHVSLPTLLRQAGGAELGARIMTALSAEVAAALCALPEGQRLGVIEIGAGAPVLAQTLCAEFDFDRGDYRFVTTAAASLEEARRLRESYPALEFCTLGPENRAQDAINVGRGSRRLAVVTLDFPSLDQALRAIDYARVQLAVNGTLVVLGFQPARWLNFVGGADPAWWVGSAEGTPLACLQPAEFWQQRLQQAGMGRPRLYAGSDASEAGAYVLISTRESASGDVQLSLPLARHWLLLADAHGYSARLADRLVERLQATGDRVSAAAAVGAAAIPDILRKAEQFGGALHGIVCLQGLDAERAQDGTAQLLDAQVQRCAEAVALVQACEGAAIRPTLCFVTADAAAYLLPKRQMSAAARPAALADAPLAGFARTLMNEAISGAVRLIDLESGAADLAVTAEALVRELTHSDAEQEVILTAAGERYAPRLRVVGPGGGDDERALRSSDRHSLRLSCAVPGQLRNLRWERHARLQPDDDQVEVAIKATGLNFRDVMYALGLLSDEAVESGFAGPSLGLEFSGIVLAVGPHAEGFAPGDAVVGFAPSSFADRVLTRARAVSLLPAGLSFESAATIPSTFFTAYYSLHSLARLKEGESVLIHGAAGGVGLAAIQIAQWCGADVYATAGSDEKRDFLRLLGVDRVFDSRTLAFADEILAQTGGQGIDVVLNSLAGEAINRNLRVLKPFGRFLELGKRDFYENTLIGLRPFRNNISYFGIDADQLMLHRPDLTQRLFAEVLALFKERALHALPYQSFEAGAVVDAFRHMQQARQIGKIVVTYRTGIPVKPPARRSPAQRLELSPHATFLITGGLSGFGLRTAEWLTERGARHLVLIGRRGPGEDEARTALARLERKGVQVRARALDVTDRAALATLLGEIEREMPPLLGIVHAAMVIDDHLIRDMSSAQIRGVFAPKILGAQNLHELTRHLSLDFFVLYSSATTLFGNPGQGNYVAANSGLEALARARRAAGLSATCIRWGAIEDVGYLARNREIKQALQGRMGGAALQSAAALEVLERLLLEDRSDVGVLELDWHALSRFLPTAASPKFIELARTAADHEVAAEGSDDLKRLLTELTPEALLSAIVELLKVEIGEILRIAPDKIDAVRPMQQMGLDSLMAVELIVAIESRFGIRLPVMALADTPTVTKLATWIITQLRGENVASDPAGPAADPLAQIERIASQHAAELPVAELERIASSLRPGEAEANRRMIQ
jgi:phthiocerol/phenolphthiocerol synthesis type-I polyketide synthase C